MKKTLQSLSESVSTKLTEENVASVAKVIWYELLKRKKLGQLDVFIGLVADNYSKAMGRKRIFAMSSEKIDSGDLEKLIAKLEKKYGAKVDVTNIIDKSLLGGLKIVSGDEVMDLSYKGKLNILKNKLTAR